MDPNDPFVCAICRQPLWYVGLSLPDPACATCGATVADWRMVGSTIPWLTDLDTIDWALMCFAWQLPDGPYPTDGLTVAEWLTARLGHP